MLIENQVYWEPHVADGYFIIGSKMKKINITDKLIMNIHYVVKAISGVSFASPEEGGKETEEEKVKEYTTEDEEDQD